MTAFEAVSVRLAEIRYADIAAHPREVDTVVVHALTSAGAPITVELDLVELWGGASGWRRAFACPLCRGAVRVLSIANQDVGCARCIPRRTRHQLRKNAKEWVVERDMDELIRRASRGRREPRDFNALARTVRCQEMQRLQHALDATRLAIVAVDGLQMVPPIAAVSACGSGSSLEKDNDVELDVELPIGCQLSKEWLERRRLARTCASRSDSVGRATGTSPSESADSA